MKGDKIHIKPIYFNTANDILSILPSKELMKKFVIVIGGESGSGKSVLAVCLQQLLNELSIQTTVLHQDDYFFLPPKSNHEKRLDDIKHVGEHEVDMAQLQHHIQLFKQGEASIHKPIVDYDMNCIDHEILQVGSCDVMILEGTYTLMLQDADMSIFMDRTYQETILQRQERGREQISAFIERILEIEHTIIRSTKPNAHVIINKNYEVELNPFVHPQKQ